ncbi:response regulator [Acidobacteria bacterium ACD]|nr:MAG: hybrid sensor histidine kinase/response regulator [Acidobacteriota bacterium]MDL1950661.1 response regulator [Acidobacteria bacterium ACD]
MTTTELSGPGMTGIAPPALRGRVLVVDDVPANVTVLSKIVQILGHEPIPAAGGEEAVEKARASRPDLVLMDVMMPGVDGIEATRRLKSDPATRLVPVVIVTALTDSDSRKRAAEAGADDFMTKPVDALELSLRIRSFLAVKQTYDELEAARQRAAQHDRLKTEFLASVSHELRTPLAAVAAAARALSRDGGSRPENVARLAPVILEECSRLGRILDEALDFARLDAGVLPWADAEFAAAPCVESVAATFAAAAEEKGVALSAQVRAPGPGEGTLRGDRDRFLQLLGNLTSNALKFTPPGGTVRLALARAGPADAQRFGVTPPAGRGLVLVAVEDTGVGIAPENQKLIFERFRQVADPATGRPSGAGLGLAICQDLVERFGGRIGLRSSPGQGSRFTVALPEAPA